MTAVYIDLKAANKNELHKRLITAIYQYRLYTEMQLNALFVQAAQQNKSSSECISQDAIQEVCADVKAVFDAEIINSLGQSN